MTDGARALDHLNQSARRIVAAANTSEWKQAVLDAAKQHAERAILWHSGSPASPAIASALETKETVVAACTESEFSQELLGQLGGASKAFVFPLAESRAVLLAASIEGKVETAALELIAQIAGTTLARIQARSTELVGIARPSAVSTEPRASTNKTPATIPLEDQPIHLRAQRFARVKVAGMQLYHDDAVKAGRKTRRLYDNLKPHIDSARNQYREQFLSASRTMVDYLHVEMVRTLAKNDDALLGLEYPGSLL